MIRNLKSKNEDIGLILNKENPMSLRHHIIQSFGVTVTESPSQAIHSHPPIGILIALWRKNVATFH